MSAKTSAAVKNKWIAKNYDRIALVVPKGKKEIIQNHAKQQGESVNAFICRSIDNQMKRDAQVEQGLED